MNSSLIQQVYVPPAGTSWEAKALAEVQEQISPEDANKVVAIRMNGGGFVLGADYVEARKAFREKFPNESAFFIRADGSPVLMVPWS